VTHVCRQSGLQCLDGVEQRYRVVAPERLGNASEQRLDVAVLDLHLLEHHSFFRPADLRP
jgi:hypothetical protein